MILLDVVRVERRASRVHTRGSIPLGLLLAFTLALVLVYFYFYGQQIFTLTLTLVLATKVFVVKSLSLFL